MFKTFFVIIKNIGKWFSNAMFYLLIKDPMKKIVLILKNQQLKMRLKKLMSIQKLT